MKKLLSVVTLLLLIVLVLADKLEVFVSALDPSTLLLSSDARFLFSGENVTTDVMSASYLRTEYAFAGLGKDLCEYRLISPLSHSIPLTIFTSWDIDSSSDVVAL